MKMFDRLLEISPALSSCIGGSLKGHDAEGKGKNLPKEKGKTEADENRTLRVKK